MAKLASSAALIARMIAAESPEGSPMESGAMGMLVERGGQINPVEELDPGAPPIPPQPHQGGPPSPSMGGGYSAQELSRPPRRGPGTPPKALPQRGGAGASPATSQPSEAAELMSVFSASVSKLLKAVQAGGQRAAGMAESAASGVRAGDAAGETADFRQPTTRSPLAPPTPAAEQNQALSAELERLQKPQVVPGGQGSALSAELVEQMTRGGASEETIAGRDQAVGEIEQMKAGTISFDPERVAKLAGSATWQLGMRQPAVDKFVEDVRRQVWEKVGRPRELAKVQAEADAGKFSSLQNAVQYYLTQGLDPVDATAKAKAVMTGAPLDNTFGMSREQRAVNKAEGERQMAARKVELTKQALARMEAVAARMSPQGAERLGIPSARAQEREAHTNLLRAQAAVAEATLKTMDFAATGAAALEVVRMAKEYQLQIETPEKGEEETASSKTARAQFSALKKQFGATEDAQMFDAKFLSDHFLGKAVTKAASGKIDTAVVSSLKARMPANKAELFDVLVKAGIMKAKYSKAEHAAAVKLLQAYATAIGMGG